MVFLTRRLHFNAAHRVYNPTWSDEQNEKVFGMCANKNWHGHNYELEITVYGRPNTDTGFVMDLNDLKRIVREAVIYKLDHKNLNLDVEFMKGIIPTTENLVIAMWKELHPKLLPVQLYSLKLYETPRNFVEYRGDK